MARHSCATCTVLLLLLAAFIYLLVGSLVRAMTSTFSQTIVISGRVDDIFGVLKDPKFPYHLADIECHVHMTEYRVHKATQLNVLSKVTHRLPYVGNVSLEHKLVIDSMARSIRSHQDLGGWIRVVTVWEVSSAKNQTFAQAAKDLNPLSQLNETTVVSAPWPLAGFVENYQRKHYWQILLKTKDKIEEQVTFAPPKSFVPRFGI